MLHIEIFVVFCSAFAGFVAWAFLSHLRRTSRYDLERIPGPRTVPFVGNLGAVIGSSYVHKVPICSAFNCLSHNSCGRFTTGQTQMSDQVGVDPASFCSQLGSCRKLSINFFSWFSCGQSLFETNV